MEKSTLFAIFLLCACSAYPPFATAKFLVDTDGDFVKNGGSYFLAPIWRPGGGAVVLQTGNEICPITVAQEPVGGSGLPVQFSTPKKILYLSEGSYLTVRFSLVPWCAPTPSQWTVLEGSHQVKLTGYNNTVPGSFKVVESADNGVYSLKFCPLPIDDGTCGSVGGARGPLVVYDSNTFLFRFQKPRLFGDEPSLGAMNNHLQSRSEM